MADPDALRRVAVAVKYLARAEEIAEEFSGEDGYEVIENALLPALRDKIKEIESDAD